MVIKLTLQLMVGELVLKTFDIILDESGHHFAEACIEILQRISESIQLKSSAQTFRVVATTLVRCSTRFSVLVLHDIWITFRSV